MKVGVGFVHPSLSITPQWRRSYTSVLMRDAATKRRIVGECDQESSANISSGRNTVVRDFLANPKRPEWLWMVDTDMTFADDLLERLLSSADPKMRPIVGGLCFGVRPARGAKPNGVGAVPLELFPTIYFIGDDGQMSQATGYPPDEVIQCHSTGAACLLIHRSVLEHDGWQDGHPFPWFRESVFAGKECSEDQFFCIKAGGLGFPVHVDTGARTGHVKTFIADESVFLGES